VPEEWPYSIVKEFCDRTYRSTSSAENASNGPGLTPPLGWLRPKPGNGATTAAIRDDKHLNLGQRQAILSPIGRPLDEWRYNGAAYIHIFGQRN